MYICKNSQDYTLESCRFLLYEKVNWKNVNNDKLKGRGRGVNPFLLKNKGAKGKARQHLRCTEEWLDRKLHWRGGHRLTAESCCCVRTGSPG